ncbi:arylsulfatase F [Lepeophtheirus salmonis]|uniref:arylsulfatase F n=1 Tax=Lepeophtheirus salmonis TaxID=72036 RepID=UPI001AE64559|nr:arylsulfatase F-like [Lepeophtheirus salmonis]XP_040563449.1 arylsulfatase F-like [Lepeophtheirus salmonis]XP_040563450.1 arylsulfatase F-like [Lepeophtheirus salmonis]XP_040563451.1 arylsulfatase F-like [Lepeophtheirus salmonis]XP_040563452.1 arylsulfatase F-like [Lepeophtheirus salmonis]XP_040563453.1 arylsulfatase F-like [Lepeophtheirus salmonis]
MERYLNSILVSNEKVVERPIQLKRLAERLTNESLKFIHQNVGVKPFLLYHAFHNLHKPVQVSDEFVGKGSGTLYSDSLVEMDYQIGRILDTLDDLSIQNNTIVFFASDHGKLGQNLPFKGGKGAPSLEGGVRIPGAIRWPNRIPSGFAINEPISLLDFFPTLNQILDTDYTLKKLDGKSFYESVSNHSSSIPRMLYHFCGIQIHALRYYDGRGSIIKGVFAKENLNSDGICSEGICICAKAALIPSEQMDILNVTIDGKEEKLSSHAENEYRSLFLKTYNDFKKEKKPSQQLDSFFRVMPIYPRLHPGILPVHIKE